MAAFSKFCTLAFASFSTLSKNNLLQNAAPCWKDDSSRAVAGPAVYPQQTIFAAPPPSNMLDEHPVEETTSDLSTLCNLLDASPEHLLRLDTNSDGVRGVYLNEDIKDNDVILKVPLDSCLRDDDPPEWFQPEEDASNEQHHTSDWATRLAATLMDVQRTSQNEGKSAWLHLLPSAQLLRASLPIHWSEETLEGARCTALELIVDSAYFARADALNDLMSCLPPSDSTPEERKRDCEHALDLVQTRSCRVEHDGKALRLLAPVFDFLNHGSLQSGSANAIYELEGDDLVVRACVDLKANTEVLIDYGESTRPPWKCLASYGFVPEWTNEEDNAVAELYVHGRRFEVGPSTIPVDLLVTMTEAEFYNEEEEPAVELTPDVALRIATRSSEVAFQMLLDQNEDGDDEEEEDEDRTTEELITEKLATSLRWSQHHTLLACAKGLQEWAAQQANTQSED